MSIITTPMIIAMAATLVITIIICYYHVWCNDIINIGIINFPNNTSNNNNNTVTPTTPRRILTTTAITTLTVITWLSPCMAQ